MSYFSRDVFEAWRIRTSATMLQYGELTAFVLSVLLVALQPFLASFRSRWLSGAESPAAPSGRGSFAREAAPGAGRQHAAVEERRGHRQLGGRFRSPLARALALVGYGVRGGRIQRASATGDVNCRPPRSARQLHCRASASAAERCEHRQLDGRFRSPLARALALVGYGVRGGRVGLALATGVTGCWQPQCAHRFHCRASAFAAEGRERRRLAGRFLSRLPEPWLWWATVFGTGASSSSDGAAARVHQCSSFGGGIMYSPGVTNEVLPAGAISEGLPSPQACAHAPASYAYLPNVAGAISEGVPLLQACAHALASYAYLPYVAGAISEGAPSLQACAHALASYAYLPYLAGAISEGLPSLQACAHALASYAYLPYLAGAISEGLPSPQACAHALASYA